MASGPVRARAWVLAAVRSLRAGRRRSDDDDDAGVDLFGRPWPADGPTRGDFVAALRAPAGAPSRVPAVALNLVRLPAGASAVAAARELLAEGYRARAGVPPFALRLPVDWLADPHRDDNWRVQLNMLRLLDPLIQAHEETGDASTLRDAVDFCLDWHRFHQRPDHANPWAWRDMMTGMRSLRLAYLAEKIRLGTLALGADDADAFASMLHSHWLRLTTPGFFRFTNHTILDVHGLMALLRIGWRDDDPRTPAWQRAIGERLDHLVERQFDEHGLHRENSPQYHFVAAGMFRALLDSGWYDAVSARLGPTLARAREMDRWMRFPDGRFVPIGDSDGSAPSARQLPEATRERPDDQTETLNSSGYCFVRRTGSRRRTRWSLLAIKAGFDQIGHMHHDVLSFLWSEAGCDIVVDPGKFAYDRGAMRDYFRSNRAHNLIEFGLRECDTQAAQRTGHVVERVQTEPWGVTVVARLRHQPLDVVHERTWHFAPGRWLVTVDRFAAAGEVDFKHFTHLAPEFSASVEAGAFQVRHADGNPLLVSHHASVAAVTEVLHGVGGLRPQGWVSRGYRHAEASPVLAIGGRARAATLVMALSLDPRGRLVTLGDGTIAWSCRLKLRLQTGPLPQPA
jgi:hypothetical protein